MNINSLFTTLRVPHLLALYSIQQDLKGFLRVSFLHAAMECGLLEALPSPVSRDDLIGKLQVRRPGLLDALLEVGVAVKELRRKGDLYSIRGHRARALISRHGDPNVAMIEEYLTYHASVYLHLAERIRGGPLGDYLQDTGELIARASRILEPFMKNFVRQVVKEVRPRRVLEVGCGSGVYLCYAAELDSNITGLGIDLHDDVVTQARAEAARLRLGDRLKIIRADIRDQIEETSGPFDLITLYNNVYYFRVEDRAALFGSLKARLASGGALAIASQMRGGTVAGADFDLILRSTEGCAALPELKEMKNQLRQAGFGQVKTTRLIPIEPFYAVLAT
jgi:4-hydroxy-2,2'-bipyrrole-5-carbaldehyde O-methyltransferase